MTTPELVNYLQRLEQRLDTIEQRLGAIPSRFAVPSGGGLPPTNGKYKPLQQIDDDGNIDWDRVRFTDQMDPAE